MTSALHEVDAWMEQLVEHQRRKVLRLAREIVPHITAEDVLNPQDYPELMRDQNFNFEDGMLAGFLSARLAFRARFLADAAPASGSDRDGE